MIRFRPIMVPTMAALIGTMPIALGMDMGEDSRRPLGLCVGSGLLFSRPPTRCVTPVIYVFLDGLAGRIRPAAGREDAAMMTPSD